MDTPLPADRLRDLVLEIDAAILAGRFLPSQRYEAFGNCKRWASSVVFWLGDDAVERLGVST